MRQLLSEDEIRVGVTRLAGRLAEHYSRQPLTIVGILTGSVVLMADLIRQLEMPLRVALIQADHRRASVGMQEAVLVDDSIVPNLEGRHVLVIDDIFDTGCTLAEVMTQLARHRPASIRSAVLLRKAGRSRVAVQPDETVFEIPDEFVVGYGIDYQDRYRDLPYVAALEKGDLAE